MDIENLKHKINGLFLNEHIDRYAFEMLTTIANNAQNLQLQQTEVGSIAFFKACKYVVDTYECDGMENMTHRDEYIYEECKQALS